MAQNKTARKQKLAPTRKQRHEQRRAQQWFMSRLNVVHNLEHGYVVIWYNCSTRDEAQCQTLKAQIKEVMQRARPVVFTTDAKKLIAAPRPGLDSLLALTAWNRIYKLNAFEETSVTQFINDFRNRAPEAGAP